MIYPHLQIIIGHLRRIDNSEKSKLGFDMNWEYQNRMDSTHPCGSACCIGGHASTLLDNPTFDIIDDLAELCNIPQEISRKICWPTGHYDATLEEAIEVLEHCRDTGLVDWDAVRDADY